MPETAPSPLSDDDLKTYFPLVRPPLPQSKTYELALTLGGTVSAGAYTAGVLDYILEALDAWQRAKDDRNPEAPTHNAVISMIAGASGGAINGTILMRLAGWQFPHGPVTGNPFYDLWVNGVDLAKLLSPNEPSASGLTAIFNTAAFKDLADRVIGIEGAPLGSDETTPKQRSFLGDPLRLSVMVGNVTGIPYRILFRGQSNLSHDLVAHADFLRFGLTVPGGVPNAPRMRPDEFALASASKINWDIVAAAALATSAFPAAFPSRALRRALAMLGYRVAAVPGERPGTTQIAQLIPTWDAMAEDGKTPNEYRTVNVDGGTFNNEPLDHARTALAGMAERNSRGGTEADRGVILIDPFSDPEQITLYDPPGLFGLIGPLISAMVQQARYKPEDIALAKDYDTYSRFLVAPYGRGSDDVPRAGSAAIASGGLGGFLGFVDRSFLDYDFKLGRRNAYDFLRDELVLPSTNSIFRDGTWTATQLTDHSRPDKHPVTGKVLDFLPIIPLMKSLRDNPPPEPNAADWPKLSAPPPDLCAQVEARLNALYTNLKKEGCAAKWWPGGLGGVAANGAWRLFLRGILRDAFVKKVMGGLRAQHLLPDV